MSNPSKAKGTRAETRVAKYLTANGLPTKRKALAGSNDEGDLSTILLDGRKVTIEVKAGAQTSNPSRSKMEEWKRQAIAEGINSGCRVALVIVRYKRRFEDAEVWLPNCHWQRSGGVGIHGWTMMYINDFVNEMGG